MSDSVTAYYDDRHTEYRKGYRDGMEKVKSDIRREVGAGGSLVETVVNIAKIVEEKEDK
jgi:hypothetical protein